jgi:hypothetical protein
MPKFIFWAGGAVACESRHSSSQCIYPLDAYCLLIRPNTVQQFALIYVRFLPHSSLQWVTVQ